MSPLDTPTYIAIVLLCAALVQVVVRASIASLVRKIVRGHKYVSADEEYKREETLLHVFRPLSRIIIWLTALIIVLSMVGVNLAAMITGAGALGLIFGVVAQSAFKDYIAGIYIIVENQYRVGDVVLLAGTVSGVVEGITIRVTKLRDLDGNVHFIRNGETGVITNMTSEWSRANIELQVGWDADIEQVKQLINTVGSAMAKDSEWREFITEPIQFYRVEGFTDSAVTIRALGQTTPIKQWDVAGEFRRRIKHEFDKHGIERPYQHRVVQQPVKHGSKKEHTS